MEEAGELPDSIGSGELRSSSVKSSKDKPATSCWCGSFTVSDETEGSEAMSVRVDLSHAKSCALTLSCSGSHSDGSLHTELASMPKKRKRVSDQSSRRCTTQVSQVCNAALRSDANVSETFRRRLSVFGGSGGRLRPARQAAV